ncbi:MAG: hypothetical protein LC624_08880 [Halobacteriales archaeon]|nr:hypothetical protein [Halobacteriales archaeon]
MDAQVLTWTRIARPPAGFVAGRVVVLVQAGPGQRYAAWTAEAEPRIGQLVRLAQVGAGWEAQP